MHPAFSVIFFTTFSGAGYGLWFWLGVLAVANALPSRLVSLWILALGFVLVSAGLLSSLLHLGQPQRAWRAFSQWRSSWLSREGVVSVLCYVPALWLAAAVLFGFDARVAGGSLLLLSVLTVVCTAMIYASLKPIPAWRHPVVVPVYLLFSVFTGGLMLSAILALGYAAPGQWPALAAILLAALLWRLKQHVWRWIDRGVMPVSRNSALGLPDTRNIKVFERPHTEANYLTREMGYVLARKHARKLRVVGSLLFAGVPALCALPVWFFPDTNATPLLVLAALSAMAGALVERWLFFAEARHVVTLYY